MAESVISKCPSNSRHKRNKIYLRKEFLSVFQSFLSLKEIIKIWDMTKMWKKRKKYHNLEVICKLA